MCHLKVSEIGSKRMVIHLRRAVFAPRHLLLISSSGWFTAYMEITTLSTPAAKCYQRYRTLDGNRKGEF